MPRWASRITLEITGVRIERLQDISEADAIAEGVNSLLLDGFDHAERDWFSRAEFAAFDPLRKFRLLWDDINGPGAWDKNQQVFAIEFRVVEARA